MSDEVQVLSMKEAAAFLGMSDDWVWKQLSLGTIPSIKLGTIRKVLKSDLVEYLKSRRTQKGGQPSTPPAVPAAPKAPKKPKKGQKVERPPTEVDGVGFTKKRLSLDACLAYKGPPQAYYGTGKDRTDA